MIKKTNIFLVLYLLLFSVLVVFFQACNFLYLSLFCVSEKKQEKVNEKLKGQSFYIAEQHYSASAECGKMQLRSIPAKKYLYLHTYNYYDYKLKEQNRNIFSFFLSKSLFFSYIYRAQYYLH